MTEQSPEPEEDGADLCYAFITDIAKLFARHKVKIQDGRWMIREGTESGWMIDLDDIQNIVNNQTEGSET